MANAGNYALYNRGGPPTSSSAASALTALLNDVGSGAMSVAKSTVMLAGCVTLLAAGVLVSSAETRAFVIAKLPSAPSVVVAQTDPAPARTQDEQHSAAAAADPQQKRIVQYLARRYRVADEAVRQLVSTAFQIGREKNLDPLLILSVVAIESSLNPFAQSSMGAQGLMQVMTRVHAQRFEPHGGEIAALDPVANMKVGSSILHELITRGGSVERGLQLYVGAGNMPDDGGYGARVLGERSRLQLAASGRVDAAITSAIRAAAPPVAVPESKPVSISLDAEVGPAPQPSSTSEVQNAPAQSERSV